MHAPGAVADGAAGAVEGDVGAGATELVVSSATQVGVSRPTSQTDPSQQ